MSEARGVPIPAPVDAQSSSRMGDLPRRILSTAVLLPVFVWILLGAPAWVIFPARVMVLTIAAPFPVVSRMKSFELWPP